MSAKLSPPQAAPSINDLPTALLARVFTHTRPRRDSLALLLTCRHWQAVAEAECPQHLWGVFVVHSDAERLLEPQEQVALLACLRRRAAYLAELRIEPKCVHVLLSEGTPVRLAPLWPMLLRAVEQSPQLTVLHVRAAIHDPDCAAFCEALGSLTSLRQLQVEVHAPENDLPLPALRPLSALTRLERLGISATGCTGDLPADLLPALGSLTFLELHLSDEQSVAWQRPNGSGPSLRRLRLGDCPIGLPSGRLLRAVQQLERLELFSVPLEEAQCSVLPQLPHLTSLALWDTRVAWPVVLRCAGLRELVVGWTTDPPPAHLPPGSLPQLTRLALPSKQASPVWLALPQLRSLELTASSGVPLPPSLGQFLQLEELKVSGHTLSAVTRAVASLTRLTRLDFGNYDFQHQQPLVLHKGPYLAGLKELKISNSGGATLYILPASLAAATSLDLLDLSYDSSLLLRGAEDAALLCRLPRLRRVLLPCQEGDEEAAAAVERIREALRAGARDGGGPPHAVGVEAVEPPW